eukprot:711127-Pyramimonas_sp.AAC.1
MPPEWTWGWSRARAPAYLTVRWPPCTRARPSLPVGKLCPTRAVFCHRVSNIKAGKAMVTNFDALSCLCGKS